MQKLLAAGCLDLHDARHVSQAVAYPRKLRRGQVSQLLDLRFDFFMNKINKCSNVDVPASSLVPFLKADFGGVAQGGRRLQGDREEER